MKKEGLVDNNITKDQAKQTLDEIQGIAERTRRMAAYAGADVLFILWGVIWATGYTATHFLPPILDYRPVTGSVISGVWGVLVTIGVAASVMVGRNRCPVRSSANARIWWMWWAFVLYANIWWLLLCPFIHVSGHAESQLFWKHTGALIATAPMFMYVLMGMWLDRYLVWIGLLVTALTLFGLYVLQSWFWLWMAAAGGGSLIATGLIVRNRWRA